jgi:hypothetical protein
MTSWLKKVIVGAALIAAFALGGAAVANALSSDNGGTAATTDQAAPSGDPAGTDGGRPGEETLTGDTATKVEQAALAETGGGTVERVETDADGNAAYEAHISKDDGTRVTVYVNEQFAVVDVEEHGAGEGPGAQAPGQSGEQGTDTGGADA